jgi:putative ABC transport system ATP-binding protein
VLLLKLENIKKIYSLDEVEVHALRGVNLRIEKGEYLAILGPSGSGKSTLMHIIGLLDRPTEGKVYLHGEDVSEFSDSKLANLRNQEVGFVFQNFNLLPRTSAIDNVEMPLIYTGLPRQERRQRTLQALKEVGLKHRLNNTPGQLSGGEQQRVAIARALINNPSLLLADEPTGNIDSKTGVEIMKLIDELHQKGNTVLLVTHDAEVADYAHHYIKLVDGQVVEDTRK